jgi:Peptidase family S41
MRLFCGVLISSIACVQPLPAQTPAAPTIAEIAAVDPRALAKELGKRLETDFVYPDQGKRYAAALRANADTGAYDALKGLELARKLSDDLQSVAVDGHLRVMFEGMGGAQIVIKRPADAEGASPAGERKPVMVKMTPPPTIEHAGWIAPGIAFVRFNLFPGDPDTVEAARKFMKTHAGAKTIIFDVRTHKGGGMAEMDEIFPWLFSKPTRLAAMATRKSVDEAGGSPIADVPTLRIVPADPNFVTREHWVTPGKDKRLRKAKIFVLTSGLSGSAAEHFALAFKHTGRATLIGSTTYGANHFGGDQDLGGGYTVFLPVGRAYDPKTGKDWEGTGIRPDIDVAPEDALIKALTLSGIAPAKAVELSAKVAPKGPMISRQ